MTKTQIVARLQKWGDETFEGATTIRVVKGEFGGWNVRVEWDEEGYFEEIHHYLLQGGRLKYLGVTEIHA